MNREAGNPFSITKSTDLTDNQILDLWVDVAGEEGLIEVARPSSPMPMLILGGKGSGKTHLMRYFSFALQRLQYDRENLSYLEGVVKDGYIGVYLRCGGLNSERFGGKGQGPDVWKDLFAYYAELWLAQGILSTATVIYENSPELSLMQEKTADAISALFDRWPFGQPKSLKEITVRFEEIQKKLDYSINNAALTGKLDAQILATRGKLIFGMPKIFEKNILDVKQHNVNFVYMLDEFENLTKDQQIFINTLVREKEVPSTLKIGARLYGVKTYATLSDGEENIKDSEFELLHLDKKLRDSKKYQEFCRDLICKRLEQANIRLYVTKGESSSSALNDFFENVEDSWHSQYWRSIVSKYDDAERPYLLNLRAKIEKGIKEGSALGVSSKTILEEIICDLALPEYPLIEKVNILIFYQKWADGRNLLEAARAIKAESALFLCNPKDKNKHKQTLEHFGDDLSAQLLRDCKEKSCYAGIENFISMSEGLPRTLVTILKNIYDWAIFNGESPFQERISLRSQRKGVLEASDWFFNNMRKAGRDGIIIQKAIERLAQLFKVNRFADKPVECSLITFSVSESELSQEALRTIDIAKDRSFLIPITGGQKDKNSMEVVAKYQLNKMLCPRWDLPLARRGTLPLNGDMANAIFQYETENEFKSMLSAFEARLTAPTFAKGKRKNYMPSLFDL